MYDDITNLKQLENMVKAMGVKPGKYDILPQKKKMEFMYIFIVEVSDGWEVAICERADVHSVRKYTNFSEAVDRFMLLVKHI